MSDCGEIVWLDACDCHYVCSRHNGHTGDHEGPWLIRCNEHADA